MTRREWLVGGMLLALGAGAAALWRRWGTVTTVLDLATAGGERRLREPMRPLRNGTRVLLLALDGVSDRTLRAMVRAGRMPQLARLLGAPQSTDVFAQRMPSPAS